MSHDHHGHHDHHVMDTVTTPPVTTMVSAEQIDHPGHHHDHSGHDHGADNVTGTAVNHALHHMMSMSVS